MVVHCAQITSGSSPATVSTTHTVTATNDSGEVLCPVGTSLLGGGAFSPQGHGASTYFAPYNDGADYFVNFLQPGDTVTVQLECGPAVNIVNSPKRASADTDRSVQQSTRVTNKVAVAAGATATAAVACPAGMLSTGGGFIPGNPFDFSFANMYPLTPGTSYFGRPDGVYEAPNGWSLTMRNNGAASNTMQVAAICVSAASPSTTDFEFYNTILKHYFRTAEAAEAIAIDGGSAGLGWLRTGLNFTVYVAGIGPGNDVCRFYNPVANTHFFTADPAECLQVKLPDSGWRYEGLSFRIQLPGAGACPQGTIPVYRNYNNRFAFNDSNHRFTTDINVYNAMIAQGWAGEGVVMCALA